MPFPVRPEWSTASVGSSHAPTDAVDHSAPSAIRPESTYISGKVVQTNGATSHPRLRTVDLTVSQSRTRRYSNRDPRHTELADSDTALSSKTLIINRL